LDNTNLQELLKNVYKDPKLKAEIINEIMKYGFRRSVEKRFSLNDHQVRELDTMNDRDQEDIITKIITSVLVRNGKIELVNENHNPPNMRINFYANKTDDGYEVGVRISC
jgi:hypothetical protein